MRESKYVPAWWNDEDQVYDEIAPEDGRPPDSITYVAGALGTDGFVYSSAVRYRPGLAEYVVAAITMANDQALERRMRDAGVWPE